ncbi:Spo0B domain-containing protein [Thalassobacillus sp. CUG 92003]|uniref:Spo0B domain-containing protein n=1 Tax=Thalassobacillus sp. CUG 92003 TaxID=2736641 RepID=UPI0015E74A2B|nr:Spo0B domain-containing protein [Thalassobacillus sp. CUG 92003]
MGQSEDIIHLLRHKRHDWMNHLQLVQGYAAMGKQDEVVDKVKSLIAEAEQERKLLNANAPHFTLWLLSFNWYHDNYRLSYTVDKDGFSGERYDLSLLARSKRVLSVLLDHSDPDVLYEGDIYISGGAKEETPPLLEWRITGSYKDEAALKRDLLQETFITDVQMENTKQSVIIKAKMR